MRILFYRAFFSLSLFVAVVAAPAWAVTSAVSSERVETVFELSAAVPVWGEAMGVVQVSGRVLCDEGSVSVADGKSSENQMAATEASLGG